MTPGRWLVALALFAAPKVHAAPPIDVDSARAVFQEAHALADRDGGSLWGVSLDGPILLADPGSRWVVASRPDRSGFLRREGSVFVGKLPADVNMANTAVTWAGVRWTMLVWPLPEDRKQRARLIAHELFHRVQERVGLPPVDPANRHLDRRDGRIWLRLEWRALERALERRGPARRRALTDALAFRQHRRERFAGAAAEEAALELHEGQAEYTGCKLTARSSAELTALAIAGLRRVHGAESFSRSFAYANGPAYGALLDAVRPGWRSTLRSDSDLAALLDLKVELPAPAARAESYGRDEIVSAETRRETERERQRAAHRARFVAGPVLLLALSSAPRWSFDPSRILPLNDTSAVHAQLRVVDEWGVLEASRGALLVHKGDRPVEVRVTAPSSIDPPTGDGWTLSLAPGWTIVPGTRRGDFAVRRK